MWPPAENEQSSLLVLPTTVAPASSSRVTTVASMVGTKPSKWCAGCHDHAVFFNGRFDRPIKEQIDTPEAHAGLACTSCHAITQVHSSMGQGDFTIEETRKLMSEEGLIPDLPT